MGKSSTPGNMRGANKPQRCTCSQGPPNVPNHKPVTNYNISTLHQAHHQFNYRPTIPPHVTNVHNAPIRPYLMYCKIAQLQQYQQCQQCLQCPHPTTMPTMFTIEYYLLILHIIPIQLYINFHQFHNTYY